MDKPKVSQTFFLSWSDTALGEPWKKKLLGYIPSPKGGSTSTQIL